MSEKRPNELSDTIASPAPYASGPLPAGSHVTGDDLGKTAIRAPGPALHAAEQRYERRSLLGVGGMGEVHLCGDRVIGREVAMKQLRPESRTSRQAYGRFVREAMVQARLEHPSVVPVYDVGLENEAAWFTMKRVRGRTLDEILRALREKDAETTIAFSTRKLLVALVQVCLAVDYAHEQGVVHRDLKPANIMLGAFGEVNVLDWGLAKVLDAKPSPGEGEPELADDEDATMAGMLMGTPGYMAPEQARGAGDRLDARTDVYALGCILYEMVTREPLHRGNHVLALVTATLREADARPSARGHDVAPELEAVCVRATALDPRDRYESARALANAIERYLDGDRDLARRRELAAEHLGAARQHLAGERDSARGDALRELGRAVALDPSSSEALDLLARLVVDAPPKLPKAAEEELERSRHASRRAAALTASRRYLMWAAFLPLAYWMGIKAWPATLVITSFIIAAGLDAARISRKQIVAPRHGVELLATSSIAMALMSALVGPLILVPGIAATNTMYFSMNAERRYRPWILLVGVLVILVPFGIEALGLVPAAYSFGASGFVIQERATYFPAIATTTTLLIVNIGMVVIPTVMVGRMRDALTSAEERLFAQAWHIRQILPAEAHDALTRGGPRT